MFTYAFKVVKMESSILATGKYHCDDYTTPDIGYIPATDSPPIYRTAKTNTYLMDLSIDNIEFIRYIANTIIQAETELFEGNTFLYVTVYALELGQKIGNETPMTLLLDLNIDTKTARYGDGVQIYNSAIYFDGRPYIWKASPAMRCSYRGSGRYEAIFIKDSPRYFTQTFNHWIKSGAQKMKLNDDFIGLDVAFSTTSGRALKHVYMGAVSSDNYKTTAKGSILFHRKGNLYKGKFDNYHKAMSILWPLFSKNKFDKDGVLVEGNKVGTNGVMNLVTEFKAQRRNAYTKVGSSEIFKAKLLQMMSTYIYRLCLFINDIQYWHHNLNYSVWGFYRSKELYLRGERMLRLISQYFPSELVFSPSSDKSRINAISSDDTLILGNRAPEVAECWDRLVMLVDWLRRNYIEYEMSQPIPPYVLHHDDDRRDVYTKTGRGRVQDFFYYGTGRTEAAWRAECAAQIHETPFRDNGYYWYNDTGTGRYNKGYDSLKYFSIPAQYNSPAGWVCYLYGDSYTQNQVGHPTYHFEKPWGDYNQWLEKTSEVAADIEKVYLTYQFNAVHFIELMAHMVTILDSKSAKRPRVSGPLPGQIIRTQKQDSNRYRIHPESLNEPHDTRPDGALVNLQVPRVPLPTFAPLQIDARALVKRCAKDNTQQDEDETEELDREREKDRNAEDREKFAEQQRELERRKLKASQKPRFKWRNEIDPLTSTQVLNEKISLYNEIADNVNTVLDVADLITTGIELIEVIAAPEASPLIAEQHMIKTAGKAVGKKVVRKIAEHIGDFEFPELPEFPEGEQQVELEKPQYPPKEGEVPKPRERYKYKPKRTDDGDEFTGDEDDPREWEMCWPDFGCPVSSYPHPVPARSNGVDLQIIFDYEPRGLRKLVQLGVKYFDDLLGGKECCSESPEDDPLTRYRCYRAKTRLPRA